MATWAATSFENDAATDWYQPHDSEIDQAVDAVSRVRAVSRLRDFWRQAGEDHERAWLGELDALMSRLEQSGAGSPPGLSP